MNNEPDYSKYTFEELKEALANVDREKDPVRVATIRAFLKTVPRSKVRSDAYKKLFDKTRQFVTLSRYPTLDKFSFAISAWFWIFPFPYGVLLIVLVALPFIGIVVNGIERPSITTLVNFRENGDVDVADFIDLPAWVIAIRVFLDYNIDTFSAIAVSGSVMLVLIVLVILLTHSPKFPDKIPKKATVLAALIINLALYSYSSVVALNCRFDYTEPILYSTTVIDKHIQRNRKGPDSYFLEVRPWGPHKEVEHVKVPSNQYWLVAKGDRVTIGHL